MADASRDAEVVDNIIVGSGFAAFATAMALQERGARFEVIDVGYDLDPLIEDDVARLAGQTPQQWDEERLERIYPPPAASAKGVERRMLFGSDFPYRVPPALTVRTENCGTELSHGLGGFGNVWGAAMMPYSAQAVRGWPIPAHDLEQSYRNVLTYVPLSAERDGLAKSFPLYTERATALSPSRRIEALLAAFDRRKARLAANGVEFGRARVAVDAAQCRHCGRCLEGCVYGAIFNPRLHWPKLAAAGVRFHKGYYALEFKERGDRTVLTAVSTKDGSVRQWQTKRLYLAAGHIATTRLIARSLGRFNEPIGIRDSQYFFFPLIAYKAIREEATFTLAEMFLEIFNKGIGDAYLHFQLYGMNSIFEHTLRRMLPSPIPLGPIANRIYLFQGFLPSDDSGHLELELKPAGATRDEVIIRGRANPRALTVARKAQALLRRSLVGFGLIPPAYLQLVPPGRSFHAGGSFPMGGDHSVYASDALGRPSGLNRVHIVDFANFPTVPSSTIGYTIMANADRIARACHGIDAAPA